MPSDKITVYYKASENLDKIIKEFSDYIGNAIKQPFVPFPVPASETVYIQESMDVSINGRQFVKLYIQFHSTSIWFFVKREVYVLCFLLAS